MKEQWQKLSQQVSNLSQREKVLLCLMGLIIIPGIIDFFLIQPVRDNSAQLTKQTMAINLRVSSFANQQDDLMTEIGNDPAMELERRIEGTSEALKEVKLALVKYTNTLIAPDKMAAMLQSMLHERGKLKLISLKNLSVAPLFSEKTNEKLSQNSNNKQNTVQDKDSFGLYRHGIELVFEGNYMTTMDYLQTIEMLPWKFYWSNFSYEVQQYPKALITLNIYTLSTSQWWIGDKDE